MNENKAFILMIGLVFIPICAILAIGAVKDGTTFDMAGANEPLQMIQPSGNIIYSGANNTNSQTNLNNAQADAYRFTAYAQATLMAAQACDIRNNCYAPDGYSKTSTALTGGTLFGVLIAAFVVWGAFKLISVFAGGGNGGY